MQLTTIEIDPSTHPEYFVKNWTDAKIQLDKGAPFICIPNTLNLSDKMLLTKCVSDLPKDLCQGSESAYGHMYMQKNMDYDAKDYWNWSTNKETKIKSLKQMLKLNMPQNINSNHGMLNCYGTNIHSLIGKSISEGIDRCYSVNTGIGNNRMKLTLNKPWSQTVSIDKACYHIEGLKTGLSMNEIKDSIYFGIIISLPTHKRGFCSIKYKENESHDTFIAALKKDREKNINVVKSPNYFTSLKTEFWGTNAGKLIEPLSVIIPTDYTILFNQFLPHGISNAIENVSIYLDIFIEEEPGEKLHNKWHSLYYNWVNFNSGYDINATIRTESGSNKYPTKGYYDEETYKYNWKVHKLWCWCMKAAPSHWPSGKQTFAVHTSGYSTAKKKGLLSLYHEEVNSNLVRFHYRKERPFKLDQACQLRCIEKGFKLPTILFNEYVVRDPSILDATFAIKFGFESI